jgi:myo-inositol 2-dehydrogenase / D-chiro-inositol 1-dehydrogenase
MILPFISGKRMSVHSISRRQFIQTGALTSAMLGFPTIIPSRVLGAEAPSKKIQVGIIGCGRIANGMDIPGVWQNQDLASIVAFADPDLRRCKYTQEKTKVLMNGDMPTSTCYQDYRGLLADPAVDAVMICTPDHWHAQLCVEAALAKKDIYVQKPLALSIAESRIITDIVQKTGRVFHLGTQQRSEGKSTFGAQFRKAAEYVRDGRIGKVKRVEIGLPRDPKEPEIFELSQPIPETFNYDLWLGCAPQAPYCEMRTHRQGEGDKVDFGRPGWMTIQDYCMGMISGWGSHHLDIALWALGVGQTQVQVTGKASFPKRRLWDVHGELDVTYTYANGLKIHIGDESRFPNGIRFVGEEGWIFCGRGSVKTTISDPGAGGKHGYWRPLEASKKSIIEGEVKEPLTRNPSNHHRVFFDSIKTRQPTNTPIQSAHESTTTCILGFMAMNLKRPLNWDPKAEKFINDDKANEALSRPERAPYGAQNALKRGSCITPTQADGPALVRAALLQDTKVFGEREQDRPNNPTVIEEPEFSLIRGTRSSLIIASGAAENHKPVLYVEPRRTPGVKKEEIQAELTRAIKALEPKWPGLYAEPFETGFRVVFPSK